MKAAACSRLSESPRATTASVATAVSGLDGAT